VLDLLDTILGMKWGIRVAVGLAACMVLLAVIVSIATLVNK